MDPTKDTAFDIEPFQGPTPIRFGDRLGTLGHILGEARTTELNDSGELVEDRENIIVRYSPMTKGVVEVSFIPGAELRFEGTNLFHCDDPVAFLRSKGFVPQESLGFFIFHELGIAVSGFDSDQVSDQAITVFEKGRWNEFL